MGCLRFVLVALIVTSCTNIVTTQNFEDLGREQNVRTVWIVDYGYHSTLVFQTSFGEVWEFAYGEWKWFAKRRDSYFRLPVTLLWPTSGTLGSYKYQSLEDYMNHLIQFKHEIYRLEVSSEKAVRVLSELKKEKKSYSAQEKTLFNSLYNLNFVELPDQKYHLFSNCNHWVSKHLNRLGVNVSGVRIYSKWEVRQAGENM